MIYLIDFNGASKWRLPKREQALTAIKIHAAFVAEIT
jgi:hypothetical protein